MANKYALFAFTWQNGAGASIFCDVGALRDSASAVVSAVPSAFTSAITLAATGVAAANPNPVPVSATVSGGTVTVIAVSGVTTGQTSGTFTVPAGGTIAVTYSVAPTLTTADIAPAAGTNVNAVLAQYLAANTAGP
jgi:hypothetical protein